MKNSIVFALLLLMGSASVRGKTAEQWYDDLDQAAKNIVAYAKTPKNKLFYVHPFFKLVDKQEVLTNAEVEAAQQKKAHPENQDQPVEEVPPTPKPPRDPLAEEDRPEEETTLLQRISPFIEEGGDFNTFIAQSDQREKLMRLITNSFGDTFNTMVEKSYKPTDADLINFVKIYLITKKYPVAAYYFQEDKSVISPHFNKMTLIRHNAIGNKLITILNLPYIQQLIGKPCKSKEDQSKKAIADYGLRDFVILAAQKLQESGPKRTFNKTEQEKLQNIVEQLRKVFAYTNSRGILPRLKGAYSTVKSAFVDNDPLKVHQELQEEAIAHSLRSYYLGGSGSEVDTRSFSLLMRYFTKEVTTKQRGKKPTEVYLQALVEYELARNIFPTSVIKITAPEEKSRLEFTQKYEKDLVNNKKRGPSLELQLSRLMKIQPLTTRIRGEISGHPRLAVTSVTTAAIIAAVMAYAAKQGAICKLGTFGWLYYKIKSKTTGLSDADLKFYARKVAPEKLFDTFTEAEAFKISQLQETMLAEKHGKKKP